MNITKDEVEVHFRFLNLSKFQAFSLEREIIGASYQETSTQGRYICSVPLIECNFDTINDYYVRQQLELQCCDIWVSTCTGFKRKEITVPKIVNRMLKYIDCSLTFSCVKFSTK